VADVLELHALCLLLGYRGRFAFGDATEVHTFLRRIRDKIASIRGSWSLFQPIEPPPAPRLRQRDPWVRRLAITAIVLAVVTLLAFTGYILILGQTVALGGPNNKALPSSPAQTASSASEFRL
jgi:type VI secretion system protein ImpK